MAINHTHTHKLHFAETFYANISISSQNASPLHTPQDTFDRKYQKVQIRQRDSFILQINDFLTPL